ncbi:MAG: DUF1203 domain-containing protein [Candidatus Eiseniibacteriota bacterium]
MTFRCIPIDSAVADRFRASGRDDAGDGLKRITVHRVAGGANYPCRHCLAPVEDGRDALLGSYHLDRPHGAYWTPSPIFVHADGCAPFDEPDRLPDVLRRPLLSVRAYDAAEQLIYELSDVAPGAEVDPLIERCLADDRTQFLNLHTARFGCFLCRVEHA